MKVADFGMAKDVAINDAYVKENGGVMPIKWSAVESLCENTFTIKSDV